MSSAENSAAPKPLSDKDIHVLAHAFSCMKTQPDIDYDALAEKTGVKDGKAAYKVLWAIKKKLATHGVPIAAASTKATGAGAKRGATNGTDGDDGETPTKKRKPAKPRAKKATVKPEDEEDHEQDHDQNEDGDEDAGGV